jgi:hypothetical protein
MIVRLLKCVTKRAGARRLAEPSLMQKNQGDEDSLAGLLDLSLLPCYRLGFCCEGESGPQVWIDLH